MGLGESEPRIFSYSGPVEKGFVNTSSNELGCDSFRNPDRENYWLNLVDDQRPIDYATATQSEILRWTRNYVINFPAEDASRNDTDNSLTRTASLGAQQGYGCIPQGEDSPGVPKILTNYSVGVKDYITCAGIKDYTFDILIAVPFGGDNTYVYGNINKQYHYSISDPYILTDDVITTNYFDNGKGNKDRYSSQGIGFDIAINNGSSIVTYRNAILSLDYTHTNSFIWKIINDNPCTGTRAYQVCFQWLDTPPSIPPIPDGVTPVTLPNCQDLTVKRLEGLIRGQQEQWIADKLAAYRATYARQCALPENLDDELTLAYDLGYHHYTLYYYDRPAT